MASTTMNASNNGGVALLLIDLQPEWYSQNDQIQSHFPDLPNNIKKLLQICRNNNIEIVHVRALYSKENKSQWMDEFVRLNPDKGNPEIDGTYEVEDFAKEIDNEMLIMKSCVSELETLNL